MEDDIKVISYNVNLFQLFAWSTESPTYEQVFNFIQEQDADIVTLQEFYLDNTRLTEEKVKELLDNYFTHIGYIAQRSKSAYGMATFSRYPIVNTGIIKFDNSANACIFTDVVISDDTVRVYNNHLQSLRLGEQNVNFLINQSYRKDVQAMDEIKDISFRYRDALQKRALQVEQVTNHIIGSPYPVIVCGDFNESPISYNYRQMRRNLNDAFIEAGTGVGYTYKGLFPAFRIDYILYSPVFKATSYQSPRVYYSDHYPVMATLRMQKDE